MQQNGILYRMDAGCRPGVLDLGLRARGCPRVGLSSRALRTIGSARLEDGTTPPPCPWTSPRRARPPCAHRADAHGSGRPLPTCSGYPSADDRTGARHRSTPETGLPTRTQAAAGEGGSRVELGNGSGRPHRAAGRRPAADAQPARCRGRRSTPPVSWSRGLRSASITVDRLQVRRHQTHEGPDDGVTGDSPVESRLPDATRPSTAAPAPKVAFKMRGRTDRRRYSAALDTSSQRPVDRSGRRSATASSASSQWRLRLDRREGFDRRVTAPHRHRLPAPESTA